MMLRTSEKIVICDNENQFKESMNIQLVKYESTIICNFDSKFGMNMRENFDPSQYSIVNTFSGNNKYKGTKGNMFEFIEKHPQKGKEFNKLLGFYDLFYGNATTSTYLNSTETSDTSNDFDTDDDSDKTNNIISNIGFPHQKIYYGTKKVLF